MLNNNLESILKYNKEFVENHEYEKFNTSKHPDRKMVIVSCMDTRLTELLPNAMSVKNGDAKIIKNAGGVIVHPFGSAMRSILVSIYSFDVNEVYIVGHEECGMANLDTNYIVEKMLSKGISEKTINVLHNSGIDVEKWLSGFSCVDESVRKSVDIVRNHPLLPKEVAVHGLVIHPTTGSLRLIDNGYKR
ncbi:MAG: beta-class carbonic anhydrase [Fusobacteriaceae bacterium]